MDKFKAILQAAQDLFNGAMNGITFGLWNNLLLMMGVTVGGFSLRKFSALIMIGNAVWIMLKHPGEPNSVTFAFLSCGYSLLCLGLITSQQLTEFRSGNAMPTASAPKPTVDTNTDAK